MMKHIFLHIIKTAGTSIRWTIKENYNDNERYECDQENFNWSQLTPEQQEQIKIIYGHLLFGIHDQINAPCKYITFLRDPVDRVISYYYYVLAHPDNPGYKNVYGLSLEEFLLKGDQGIVSNQQSQMLCGLDSSLSFDLACENIDKHFSFVGIVEEYRTSIKLLSKQLNWQNVIFHELNRTVDKPAIPMHLYDVIEEKNQVDRKLYEWIKQNYKTRYA